MFFNSSILVIISFHEISIFNAFIVQQFTEKSRTNCKLFLNFYKKVWILGPVLSALLRRFRQPALGGILVGRDMLNTLEYLNKIGHIFEATVSADLLHRLTVL